MEGEGGWVVGGAIACCWGGGWVILGAADKRGLHVFRCRLRVNGSYGDAWGTTGDSQYVIELKFESYRRIKSLQATSAVLSVQCTRADLLTRQVLEPRCQQLASYAAVQHTVGYATLDIVFGSSSYETATEAPFPLCPLVSIVVLCNIKRAECSFFASSLLSGCDDTFRTQLAAAPQCRASRQLLREKSPPQVFKFWRQYTRYCITKAAKHEQATALYHTNLELRGILGWVQGAAESQKEMAAKWERMLEWQKKRRHGMLHFFLM